MKFKYTIEGGDFTKAGHASSAIKKVLKQLNVDSKVIKRIVVALYEGEVNVVAHAYEGVIEAEISAERIFVKIEDRGPGIPDINLAMTLHENFAAQGWVLKTQKSNNNPEETVSITGFRYFIILRMVRK